MKATRNTTKKSAGGAKEVADPRVSLLNGDRVPSDKIPLKIWAKIIFGVLERTSKTFRNFSLFKAVRAGQALYEWRQKDGWVQVEPWFAAAIGKFRNELNVRKVVVLFRSVYEETLILTDCGELIYAEGKSGGADGFRFDSISFLVCEEDLMKVLKKHKIIGHYFAFAILESINSLSLLIVTETTKNLDLARIALNASGDKLNLIELALERRAHTGDD